MIQHFFFIFRYKKKSESDRSQYTLDSIRAKLSNPLNNSRSLISSNQNNPWTNNHSSTTLSPNESTLDFATHRSTNYPKSSDLKPGEEIEMQTISGPVLTSNGFDDMDFMMTSEPVVSRKPFMQAQAMNGNRGMDQLDLFSGFDHRLSQNRDIRVIFCSYYLADRREELMQNWVTKSSGCIQNFSLVLIYDLM